MTLVRTLHVFLQHSSPHKTLSTLAALGHSQEAVSLTERCWMTLSIYWGAQHNLAPVGGPQYPAQQNILLLFKSMCYISLHQNSLSSFSVQQTGVVQIYRKAVRDEAMHRLGCSYIVNLPWSLLIHCPYWSTL